LTNAGRRVAVPQLGEVEPNDVEPLRLLVNSFKRLVLGCQALVGDGRDLACRAAHVLRCTGVEQGGKLAHQHRVADLKLRLAGLAGKHLWVALADRVRVVQVAPDLGTVTFEFRLGLQGLSRQAALIAAVDLNQPVGQLTQGDVMLIDKDARGRQHPATVVGKPQIDRASDVDVADAATFLRMPDSAPPEQLT
jgi:hypothetical protein